VLETGAHLLDEDGPRIALFLLISARNHRKNGGQRKQACPLDGLVLSEEEEKLVLSDSQKL
jgi:hypothetical protein